MTDLDAILRAVVADPADDTPRLVYAEVCDDAGEHERAEFIREQCELARLPELVPANVLCHQVEWEHFAGRLSGSVGKVRFEPPAPGASSGVGVLHYERRNPAREPLGRREQELFDANKCQWFGGDSWAIYYLDGEREDAEGQYPAATKAIVSRGFVGELMLPLSALVRIDLAAVFAVHPIARVVLADREPTAASHQSGAWQWVWVENDADSRVGLPRKLMAALSASGIARVFDSRDAAMDGLSLACVNLGRAAAGLDPLT